MTTETIHILSLGPIREAKFDLKRYMLFIGLQASGKSTVAKLLAALRDIEFVLRGDHKRDESKEHFRNFNLHDYFSESTYIKYESDKFSIILISNQWKISITKEFALEIEQEQDRIRTVFKSLIKNPQLKTQNENEASPNEEYLKQFYEANWKNWFALLQKHVYIPAERNFFSMIVESPFTFGNALPLPKCTREFGTYFDLARNFSSNYNIDYLNIRIGGEKGKIKVYFSPNNSIPLSESASGIQAVVPLHLVVDYLKNGSFTFITEEPELNLFPTTQRNVINFLVASSHENQDKSRLIITTHSPYVLTALSLLLYAYKTNQRKPNRTLAIAEIIPQKNWINPDEFNAYYFANGIAERIINADTKLISDNELDAVSDDMRDEFLAIKDIADAS